METAMSEPAYVPPEVWQWNEEDGWLFAKLNRPIAGATHERALPRGKHPFQLYSMGTPNGQKVTILFEELLAAGFRDAEYDAWLVSIMDGEQFGSGFVSVNPSSKVPALLDCSGAEPFRVFESGAILRRAIWRAMPIRSPISPISAGSTISIAAMRIMAARAFSIPPATRT
jgi:GST-like protein